MAQLLSDQTEISGNLQSLAENGFSDQLAQNEQDETILGGSFGSGDISAIGQGVVALGAKAGLAASSGSRFLSGVGDSINQTFNPSAKGGENESLYNDLDRTYLDALKQSRPDPNTTGYVAQIANGLIGTVPFYLIPEIGLGVAMAAEGNASYRQSIDSGLTTDQATDRALMDAMWAGIYGRVPAAFAGGKTLSAVKGAVASIGVGVANRFSTGAYLESIDHPEMAKQYEVFDTQALFTDLVFGAAFGFAHGGKVEPNDIAPPPSMVDAAAVANQAKHQEINSSEGIPSDTEARQAHNEAFELAMEQIQTDRPVDVAEITQGKSFVAHPVDQTVHDIIHNTLIQNGFFDSVESLRAIEEKAASYGLENLPDSYDSMKVYKDQSTITSRLQDKIDTDFEGNVKEYGTRPDALGGKILNTDIARELSPDYLQNRSLSADVHEPASKFVKDLYAKKLAESPVGNEKDAVLFTAGGTGAGKTTAVSKYMDTGDYQIVYDTNMNKYETSKQKIEQALAAGKDVDIAMVYRDPVEALTGGALPRAMRQAKEFGTGRTVPISEHIKTHQGSAETIIKLSEEYKDDPRVNISIIDNSKGYGKAEVSTVDLLKSADYTNSERDVRSALDEEYRKGNISAEVYAGFKAESLGRTENGGRTEQKPVRQESKTATIDSPSLVADANGYPEYASIALLKSDLEINSIHELAKGFEPAAECAMRFGQ